MSRMFRREEENLLMLQQFLSDLSARFQIVKARGPDSPLFEPIEAIVGRYLAHQADQTGANGSSLPDWTEAFRAEQLLATLMSPDEAAPELTRQLAELKKIDPATYDALSAERDAIAQDAAQADRIPSLLVAAQRAVQWKNTQRWVIRRLGTIYAGRLRFAFMVVLAIAVALVLVEALALGDDRKVFGFDTSGYFQAMSLSGLGFAAAAGLLGASFSAMTGQGSVVALDNIEEASAATSWKMIALRLGVGFAAAMILYFFFQAQLVEGVLFPDLAAIGFGEVQPSSAEVDEALAMMRQLSASQSDLFTAIDAAKLLGTGDAVALEAALDDVGGKLRLVESSAIELKNAWRMPLGQYVPNADLSKLVVWCFAAGFVQSLVPSLLATVAKTGDAATARTS